MEIQQKPDYLIFAEDSKSGELSDFPNISRGWGITLDQTQGKPPLEWMNSTFNRVDKNTLYLLQQGVPEWSEKVLYPIGAIIKVGGILYESKTKNTNLNPTNSPNDWQLVVRFQDATTKQKGIVQLSSAVNSTAENQAATPKAVKTAYDLANNALPKTGGTLTGPLTGTDITAKTSLTVGSAKATDSTTGLNFDKPLLVNNVAVLKQGDHGLGGSFINIGSNSYDDVTRSNGFYYANATATGDKPQQYVLFCQFGDRTNHSLQIASHLTSNKFYVRRCYGGSWDDNLELITTANIANHQSGLGINQTWQDVKSDRGFDVNYINSTGKPIYVSVVVRVDGSSGKTCSLLVGDVVTSSLTTENYSQIGNCRSVTLSAIVPNGSTYTLSSPGFRPNINKWSELR